MITYKTGNILDEEVEALVNTVNCVGVMGRGIALHFKKTFPDNFKAYAKACKNNDVVPGKMFIYDTNQLGFPRLIINFPTKRHWRHNSRLSDIELGLKDLIHTIKKYKIESIAVPPLGSGLGGLEWSKVKRLIEQAFADLPDVTVIVFEPSAGEDRKNIPFKQKPKITSGKAVMLGLMDAYVNGLLVPFITLLEVHKLLYFMQVSGEELRLEFKEAPFGPYAENLRHVLHKVEGHYIKGFSDDGDKPNNELRILPGVMEEVTSILDNNPRTKHRFERVADLVEGFESPFGLELLSTVHWVAKKHPTVNTEELTNLIHQWNPHKKQFSQRHIAKAYEILSQKQWL